MPEFDRVIRGGTAIDGLRTPRYRADVAIKNGRIARIGSIDPGQAAEALDAEGMIVAPGFVDLHTHYDSQLFWDPYCTISGWHGVTSVVIGNCDRHTLINGEVTFEDGECTGRTPGVLLRHGQTT